MRIDGIDPDAVVGGVRQRPLRAKRLRRWHMPGQVMRALGVSWRQLQYWDHTRLVTASRYKENDARRRYTAFDLVTLKVLTMLRAKDRSLQQLRKFLPLWQALVVQAGPDLLRAKVLIDRGLVLVVPDWPVTNLVAEVSLDVAEFLREAQGIREMRGDLRRFGDALVNSKAVA